MDNFIPRSQRILDILQQIDDKKNFNRQIRRPKLSDLELIAIDLTVKYMGIDSEHHLFQLLPESLSSKIDHTVYNIRSLKLFADKIHLQHNMSNILNGDESYFIRHRSIQDEPL